MTNKLSLTLFAALFAAVCAGQTPATEPVTVPGKVNADLLNVRVGANVNTPVAGKLPADTEIKIIREVGNWLEISAPEMLKLYISEARVNPDGTLNGELNIRAGMSTSAAIVGVLPKGAKVERIDERANGWVRIKPPAGLKVYVLGFFVSYDKNAFAPDGLPKAAAGASAVKAAPAEEKKAEGTAEVKTEKPAPAAGGVTAVEKPENVTMNGVLTKWKYSDIPETAYALLDAPKGRCQGFVVFSDGAKLAALDGKSVTVTGRITGRTAAGAAVVTADTVVENSAK